MRGAVILLGFVLVATASSAADYEYGSPDELRGVKSVYIDASDAIDLRNIMAAILRKRLPAVEVLSSSENADVVLIFEYKQLGRKAFTGELLAVRFDAQSFYAGSRQLRIRSSRGWIMSRVMRSLGQRSRRSGNRVVRPRSTTTAISNVAAFCW